jgi:hypothetical protein
VTDKLVGEKRKQQADNNSNKQWCTSGTAAVNTFRSQWIYCLVFVKLTWCGSNGEREGKLEESLEEINKKCWKNTCRSWEPSQEIRWCRWCVAKE